MYSYSQPPSVSAHCVVIVTMVTLVAGGWNPATDPDANALFSSHTVEEIRQIEQKTR